MAATKKTKTIIAPEEFVSANFIVKPDEGKKNDKKKAMGKQDVEFIKYKYGKDINGPFTFKSGIFTINNYGLPPKEYVKDGKAEVVDLDQRSKFKLARDENQDNLKKLFEMYATIDELMESETTKKRLFGDKANEYHYVSIIRQPENNPNGDKPDYAVLKLETNYEDENKVDIVLFERVDGEPCEVEVEGSKEERLDFLKKYINLNTKMQFIGTANKVWISKSKAQGSKTKGYGVGLKIHQIEILEKPQSSKSSKDKLKKYYFDDDEDEGRVVKKLDKKKSMVEEKEDSEDTEETDKSDESEKSVKVEKSKGSKSKKVESDDEEEDDDDEEESDEEKSEASESESESEKSEEKPKKQIKSKGKGK
jgi:hypothetical protein